MTATAVAVRRRPRGRPSAPKGLTEAEAARLLAESEPFERPATSRSYASIVRANVFTVSICAILAAIGLWLSDERFAPGRSHETR